MPSTSLLSIAPVALVLVSVKTKRKKGQSDVEGRMKPNNDLDDPQRESWFCLDCGFVNPADVVFCGKCGQKKLARPPGN